MSEPEQNDKKQSDRWFPIFCAVMVVLLLLNTFVVKLAVVDGRSMYPTLHDRQLLLVLRPGYQPKLGDVVVIHTGDGIFNRDYIVKRVIATEGQTVDIDFSTGSVYVDGVLLKEDYINELTFTEEGTEFPLTVPEGSIFVMGDNRNHSNDSRDSRLGTVDSRYVIGKAVVLAFPGPDIVMGKRDYSRIGVIA